MDGTSSPDPVRVILRISGRSFNTVRTARGPVGRHEIQAQLSVSGRLCRFERLCEELGASGLSLRARFAGICELWGFFHDSPVAAHIDLIGFNAGAREIYEIYVVDVRSMVEAESCLGVSRRSQ
jgi:hypothetical protein